MDFKGKGEYGKIFLYPSCRIKVEEYEEKNQHVCRMQVFYDKNRRDINNFEFFEHYLNSWISKFMQDILPIEKLDTLDIEIEKGENIYGKLNYRLSIDVESKDSIFLDLSDFIMFIEEHWEDESSFNRFLQGLKKERFLDHIGHEVDV